MRSYKITLLFGVFLSFSLTVIVINNYLNTIGTIYMVPGSDKLTPFGEYAIHTPLTAFKSLANILDFIGLVFMWTLTLLVLVLYKEKKPSKKV